VRLRVLAFPCAGVVDWLLPKRLRKIAAIAKVEEKSAFEVEVDGDERRESGWVVLSSHRVVKIREGYDRAH
jgi:hypothetical protein